MSLTYGKLRQLSRGLGISIAELFDARSPQPSRRATTRRSVSRAGQGQSVQTSQYEYRYQFTDLARKRMIPIVARLDARSISQFGELIQHPGEEYFYVLKGRVAVHTEFYTPDLLEEGDGIYLDSSMGHAYLNAGDGPALGLCVISAEADMDDAAIELVRERLGAT